MAFDSRQYEWADITLLIGGRVIRTARGIKWTRKVEREAVYGKGREPISIQSGNNSYEGEFTLLQSDFDAIEAAAGNDILSLSVDCIVNFGNPSEGNAMKTHKVLGARFTEDTFDMKQGDKFTEITVPWIAKQILKNT